VADMAPATTDVPAPGLCLSRFCVYRHGLRAIEACDLEWSQVDFKTATLHVRRAKNGKPATHPIRGDELRRFASSAPT
jgi:integrase